MIENVWAVLGMLLYVAVLFAIAQWGEGRSKVAQRWTHHPVTFALSLTIYCTAWTYYGLVGMVATSGFLYVGAFIAPAVAMIFSWSFYRRLIKIKNRYRITSIVDFLVARYHKSNTLGVIASIFILFGIVPYIAIQLKVIIETFLLLVGPSAMTPTEPESHSLFDMLVVLGLMLFTIIFGVRRIDPTERHRGIMLAIAFESLVKIVALTAAGIFVCWGLNDGLGDLLQKADQALNQSPDLQTLVTLPRGDLWLAFFILGVSSFLFLPRQFHVAVIENHDVNHLRTAQWLVPAYMLLITLFVVPIAIAGFLKGYSPQQADTFVILLPIAAEAHGLSFFIYIGGFSAAMGMIIVSAMTVATILTNNLILPIVEHYNVCLFMRQHILRTRWILVTLLIGSGYLFYKNVAEPQMLVQIGLVSFVATLQFAPLILGGLYWTGGSKRGAIAGLIAGASIWVVTMVIPMFVSSGWLSSDIMQDGLFGISLLRPHSLFGTGGLHPLSHAVLWSLLVTTSFYILFSRRYPMSKAEELNANDFVRVLEQEEHLIAHQTANILLAPKREKIEALFAQYFSQHRAATKLQGIFDDNGLKDAVHISISQLSQLSHAAESALAGTIGISSAHKALGKADLISTEEQQALSATYADMIAKLNISPAQLKEKVDYYQEREALLAHNAEELQHQVEQRTTELKITNDHLLKTLAHLNDTQAQLLEADKMAALGGLVAGVAHEINTPLGISITAASHLQDASDQLLQKFEGGKLTKNDFTQFFDTNGESLKILLSNTHKAAELVRSFKQVAVDRSSSEIRSFDMKEYIHEILLSLKPKFKHTPHTVSVDCPDGLMAKTYPGALSQILTNLVMNSLLHAFTPDRAGHITLKIHGHEDRMTMVYQDDGCGMPPEVQSHLFEPFFTTKRGQGGSGLGAHIVFNLVTQKLKGSIRCQSEPDKGTEFTIDFAASLES